MWKNWTWNGFYKFQVQFLVLFFSNDVFVKRVQRMPNKLIIKSANPDYEPFEINLSEEHNTESIMIIGQVVWLGRRI